MKKLLFFAIAYVGISLLACQDGTEDVFDDRDLTHYRNIGEQIPNETAARWLETYRSREQADGRTNLLGLYSISESKLGQLLSSVNDATGVAFHHATDSYGQHHWVLIPVDESLLLWPSDVSKLYLDANTNTFISKATAETWTSNYELAHPGEVWFHFFGSNIFDEILTIPYFETMVLESALDDLNLSPQLLLIVPNDGGLLGGLGGLLGGRTNDDECRVYDASSPCPPCAVH